MNQRQGMRKAVLVGAAAVLAVTTAPAATAAAPEPPLRLTATVSAVTLTSYEEFPGVELDLGVHVIAGPRPLEIRAKRRNFKEPIAVTQVVTSGGRQRTKALPAGLLKDFSGFPDFLRITVTDAAGRKVVDRNESFCPNGQALRTRRDAPARSPYPQGCPQNPFTYGSVWGIQAGWGVSATGYTSVDLPAGTYTAKTSVNPKYRKLFSIPSDKASATVRVTVRVVSIEEEEGGHEVRRDAGLSAAGKSRAPAQARTQRPTTSATVPAGPKPDLRSLPASGIFVMDGSELSGDEADTRQFLTFGATVWNAGPSPLVVDGFRRAGRSFMDAYQYFYDSRGRETGSARTGTFGWDKRDGHEHWHFTDFASYSLLDSTRQLAVRSQKESFCLANTDAVDYTLPNANWAPSNTDLHTSCGWKTALAVRQVLDVGSGDTYSQWLPGQSFDITSLPNGTYYIEVLANPDGRLHEVSTRNNLSLRKVYLRGTLGHRRAVVPAHALVNAS
jgi:hypothetical protein